jgi:hypothetical protein
VVHAAFSSSDGVDGFWLMLPPLRALQVTGLGGYLLVSLLAVFQRAGSAAGGRVSLTASGGFEPDAHRVSSFLAINCCCQAATISNRLLAFAWNRWIVLRRHLPALSRVVMDTVR